MFSSFFRVLGYRTSIATSRRGGLNGLYVMVWKLVEIQSHSLSYLCSADSGSTVQHSFITVTVNWRESAWHEWDLETTAFIHLNEYFIT
jgi:hypothetical protein